MRDPLGDNTIATALARHRGEGPGFGLMRLTLATLIFFVHARSLAALAVAVPGQDTKAALAGLVGWTGPTRPFYVAMVPMFFTLSGFLVTGSAFRVRATSTFLAFRALRIFPALSVEITLSALFLGPIFTTLPLRRHNYVEPALAFVTAALFAALSWHNLEKPMLAFKNRLPNHLFPARKPAREPAQAAVSGA
jgi:peptidoglycan/LPS O-acetylase OafA/YrhL